MTIAQKILSREEAIKRIYRYCAYQERSHQEVRNKLHTFGLSAAETNEIMSLLIEGDFLNEERFARSFAGGKFRLKHWGKRKIEIALERKGLTSNCINIGLSEIEPSTYIQTLSALLTSKNDQLDEENPFIRRDKLSKFAIGKGFEPDLVWEQIRRLFS